MTRARAAGARFAVFAVAIGAAACGPSFQAVYEGNVRFEHCYALEENQQAAMPDKASCWRDWSEHYTFGQTHDRVHYATARYVALSRMGAAPTDEALMMAAPGEAPRESRITAPTPSNAFAPPPKVMDSNDPKPGGTAAHPGEVVPLVPLDAGAPTAATVSLPASSCGDGCSGSYRGCSSGCDHDAGATRNKECTACEKTYRTCMRGCFK